MISIHEKWKLLSTAGIPGSYFRKTLQIIRTDPFIEVLFTAHLFYVRVAFIGKLIIINQTTIQSTFNPTCQSTINFKNDFSKNQLETLYLLNYLYIYLFKKQFKYFYNLRCLRFFTDS